MKQFFIIVLFIFLLSFLLHWVVYGKNELSLLFAGSHPFKKNIFWTTSFGISVKAILDNIITSILLWFGFILLQIKVDYNTILKITSYAYMVFAFQLILEFLYINIFFSKSDFLYLQDFSLLSTFFLAKKAGMTPPYYLNYLLQTLGIFEVLYWLALTVGIKKITAFSFSKSFKIVFLFYILPLFVWLLIVTYITVLNS